MKAEKKTKKIVSCSQDSSRRELVQGSCGEKAEKMASGLQVSLQPNACAEAEATDQPGEGRREECSQTMLPRGAAVWGSWGSLSSHQPWQVADVLSTTWMVSHTNVPRHRPALPWQSSDALRKGDIEIHGLSRNANGKE